MTTEPRRAWLARLAQGTLAVSAGALAPAWLLTACQKQAKAAFKSTDITGATYARDFKLKDAEGRERSLADFAGKVVVVFFGYTQCPDACPTTMAALVEVKKKLGAQGDKLQGVFISVDPARDTPQMLKSYVAAFDPSFLGLTGSKSEIDALTREFKVFYMQAIGPSASSYTVDHTAASFVFDPQGKIRLYASYNLPAADLAGDIQQLINGA